MIPMNMNGIDHTLIRSSRARIDLGVWAPAGAGAGPQRLPSADRGRTHRETLAFLVCIHFVPTAFVRETA